MFTLHDASTEFAQLSEMSETSFMMRHSELPESHIEVSKL
jgi:hypothetical protein